MKYSPWLCLPTLLFFAASGNQITESNEFPPPPSFFPLLRPLCLNGTSGKTTQRGPAATSLPLFGVMSSNKHGHVRMDASPLFSFSFPPSSCLDERKDTLTHFFLSLSPDSVESVVGVSKTTMAPFLPSPPPPFFSFGNETMDM